VVHSSEGVVGSTGNRTGTQALGHRVTGGVPQQQQDGGVVPVRGWGTGQMDGHHCQENLAVSITDMVGTMIYMARWIRHYQHSPLACNFL